MQLSSSALLYQRPKKEIQMQPSKRRAYKRKGSTRIRTLLSAALTE